MVLLAGKPCMMPVSATSSAPGVLGMVDAEDVQGGRGLWGFVYVSVSSYTGSIVTIGVGNKTAGGWRLKRWVVCWLTAAYMV